MFNTLEMFSILEDMDRRHAKAVEEMNMEHAKAVEENQRLNGMMINYINTMDAINQHINMMNNF